MSSNNARGDEPRPADSSLRAIRRFSLPTLPEPKSAVCDDEVAAARADAARLIDLLAESYALHARKTADVEQRRKEVAAAVKEIAALTVQVNELQTGNHRLLKERGALSSTVHSVRASLSQVLEARDDLDRRLQQSARELRDSRVALAEINAECERLSTAIVEQSRLVHEARTELAAQTSEFEKRSAESEKRAAELEKRSAASEKRVADLSGELAQLTERFLAFVNEAHEDRRREVQTISELIDQAQNGTVWRVKRLLAKLWHK